MFRRAQLRVRQDLRDLRVEWVQRKRSLERPQRDAVAAVPQHHEAHGVVRARAARAHGHSLARQAPRLVLSAEWPDMTLQQRSCAVQQQRFSKHNMIIFHKTA